MWGVQGYDSTHMVQKVTKYQNRVFDPKNVIYELDKALEISSNGRPGPVWIDIPMNIQSTKIELKEILHYENKNKKNVIIEKVNLEQKLEKSIKQLVNAKRPLLWVGQGVRISGAVNLLSKLVDALGIPTLVSWAGIDMIDSEHPLVFGRAGTYGQRCANFILQNCDYLLCIGTRLSISQIGYELDELARDAEITVIDIDLNELDKFVSRKIEKVCANAKEFIELLIEKSHLINKSNFNQWISKCNGYKKKYPWFSKTDHPDLDGFINSYQFMDRLNKYLKPNQIITTDMGTALLSGHQVLKIKEGQRLMTSTGLGEMGYGLPAAIGASIANNKSEVLCLNCDGGMMMNLQELQTIVHYKLPIKIIIFNNDGYLMIKHTQNALFNGRRSGVDKETGVSCPNFSKIAEAFNLPSYQIRTWEDFEKVIPEFQNLNKACICEVFMHPFQTFVPKLSLAIQKDGTLVSPPLEDLSPLLSREELKENMLTQLHQKSINL